MVAVELDQELGAASAKGSSLSRKRWQAWTMSRSMNSMAVGTMRRAIDVRDRVGRRLEIVKGHQQVDLQGGQGQQPQDDLGHHGQRALRADQQLHQVVAGHVLDQLAAHLHDLARGQDHLQAADIVLGRAILDRPRAARALGDVAADGAGVEAGRVGRVEEPLGLDRAVQVAGDDARLDGDHQVVLVDLQDAVHLFQGEDNAALHGHRTAAQAVARPAGCNRYPLTVGQFEHLGHLLGRGDTHDHLGLSSKADRLVVGVGLQAFGVQQHVLRADDTLQLAEDPGIDFLVHGVSFRCGVPGQRRPGISSANRRILSHFGATHNNKESWIG